MFDQAIEGHLRSIDRSDRMVILDAIEQQLLFEPNVQTRNRKALRLPNSLNVTWELRCGANNRYRVFYDVDTDSRSVVVLAVGDKRGDRLFLGSKEIEL